MKRILLLLCLALLTSAPTHAQRQLITELLPQLQTAKEDTSKVWVLNRLALEYAFIFTDSSLLFANQAIILSEKLNCMIGKIDALLILGLVTNKFDLKKALLYDEQALKLAEEIKDEKRMADACKQIGQCYGSQGSFAKASDYQLKALELSRKIGDKKGMGQIYINLANNRNKQKKHEEMIQYGQEAIKIGEEIKDEVLIADAYVVLGNYYAFVEKNTNKGREILEKSLKIRQKRGNKRGQISLLRSIGSCYKDEKKYDLARKYYQQALQIADELKDKQAYCFTLCGIADLLQLQNKLDSSIYYYEKSLTISNTGNYYTEQQRAFLALHKAYFFQKKFEKAYHYTNLFHSLNDSITNIDNAKKIKEMKVDFELEKKEKEIALLNTEKALQTQEIKNQKLTNYLFAGGLSAMFAVALLIFRSKQKEQKLNLALHQKNDEISQQNEEIKQQSEEIFTQSEKLYTLNKLKDRLFSIIAHDLRSPIASLKNTAEQVSFGELSKESLSITQQSMKNQLRAIHSTLNNLLEWSRTQVAGAVNLAHDFPIFWVAEESINFLAEQAQAKKITIENHIPEGLKVNADIEQIRTVMRNLIGNAIKFSHENTQITANASEQLHTITISVSDQGIGMTDEQIQELFKDTQTSTRGTAGEKGTGLGLMLCKDFVEKNGGTLWVESTPAQGSTFYFTLVKV
jgi:signal transduction histidine kinase